MSLVSSPLAGAPSATAVHFDPPNPTLPTLQDSQPLNFPTGLVSCSFLSKNETIDLQGHWRTWKNTQTCLARLQVTCCPDSLPHRQQEAEEVQPQNNSCRWYPTHSRHPYKPMHFGLRWEPTLGSLPFLPSSSPLSDLDIDSSMPRKRNMPMRNTPHHR